jgi:hypothetical protein
MTQANDSILVTPGSGATVATHLVSAKEYQVVMVADSDGHIQHSGDFYKAIFPSQAVGASKFYLDLFNATGTGKTMKVYSIWATVDNDTAVTGTLGVQLSTFRTTAIGTGGTAATSDGVVDTAATISKWNTSVALPAGVTARLAPAGGGTQGAWLGSRWLFTEETNAASGIAGTLGADFVLDLDVPLTVTENTGIRINQGTVASVGQIAFEVLFELV